MLSSFDVARKLKSETKNETLMNVSKAIKTKVKVKIDEMSYSQRKNGGDRNYSAMDHGNEVNDNQLRCILQKIT